jgi:hypothetical protein
VKEPNWTTATEEQVWKYVATHLAKNGIDTILVGGGVVAIYTEGAYRSGDLDFVLLTYLNDKLPKVMKEIGFEVSQGRHYKHPLCKHIFVEFVSGPAGIGEDTRIEPAEVRTEGAVIKIYSPTDCIRDRLASYIHFKAGDCLEQAVLVARRHPFDRGRVKRWCAGEGAPEAFEEFDRRLKLQE